MTNAESLDLKSFFNQILQHTDNLCLILTNDLIIKEVNRQTLKIFGWKKKDIINQSINNVFNKFNIRPFINMENPVGRSTITTTIPKEKIKLKISWDILPFVNKSKKINLIFILGKLTNNLNDKDMQYMQIENVVKYAPGLFYWKDKNSVYLGCNDEFANLAGFKSREEVIGKTDFDLIWRDRALLYIDVDQEVIRTGNSKLNHEEKIIISNNKTITAITNKVPLLDNKNKVIGMMGITTDVTEQKITEEALSLAKIAAEAANQAKTEFIANISHDIRTPLTGIITFSRFLKEEEELNKATRQELAGDIHHASEQLLNLLNSVLDVVSADSVTDHDLNLKSFNLIRMIDEVIHLEKPAVKSRQLELIKSIDKNIPEFIVSDKMKVHRILLNLIGNAIKFTEKGYIKLSVDLQSKDVEKATVVFSVEDTGIGISEEAQKQIFERFYKISPSYKGKYTGNGMGLSIVQTYLQLLEGKIEFHSSFGKGTTFSVTLTFLISDKPKNEVEDESDKELLEQEKEGILLEKQAPFKTRVTAAVDHINSNIRILLVEDNVTALKSLKMLFLPFKLHVFGVENAEEALELVKKEAFDLIITDIGLPEMQGDELVAEIRQLEKKLNRSRGKIIALTGHATGSGELAAHCKEAGVDEIIQKPMQHQLLKNLLEPLMKKEQEKAKPMSEVLAEEKSSSLVEDTLGKDLPSTETQLFEMDHHPLLDLKVGIEVLGSEDLVKDILKTLNEEAIAPELVRIKKAHASQDWETIGSLAHKIKGGATYGTVRLYSALLYMERYLKAGHINYAEALYQQMLQVIDDTVDYLDKHL